MPQLSRNMSLLGTETAFDVLARAAELQRQGKDIINLGIGQPDFKTAEHIVEAAVKAARGGEHGYTPAQGILQLREAVAADLHKRHGVEVNPGNVVIMPGGKPTIFFSILMFGEPETEIMYPDPGFPIYRSMIEYSRAKPVPIVLREENGFSFSADEVLANVTNKTRLIILNSPGNPTGGVVPKSEIERLLDGLEAWPDVAILSDEIYSQHVALKKFLHQHLYSHEQKLDMTAKVQAMVRDLFDAYMANVHLMPDEFSDVASAADDAGRARVVADYIAGMTDRFAMTAHEALGRC